MGSRALTTQDDFENWLASLSDMLETFLAELPTADRERLDISPASLDVLEAWIIAKYPDTKSMLAPSESETVNGLACYVGETFRKALGGRWTICLDAPESAFFGLPIVVGAKGRSTDICPLALVTATADRRKGTYLRTILDNALRN